VCESLEADAPPMTDAQRTELDYCVGDAKTLDVPLIPRSSGILADATWN
jgi:hypothetical protein